MTPLETEKILNPSIRHSVSLQNAKIFLTNSTSDIEVTSNMYKELKLEIKFPKYPNLKKWDTDRSRELLIERI